MRLYIIPILYGLLLTSCSSVTGVENASHIITLSYYPDCGYEDLGNVVAEHGMDRVEYLTRAKYSTVFAKESMQGNQKEAVQRLKIQANHLGADAIAIIDYKALQQKVTGNRGQAIPLSKYIYRAKALRLNCQQNLEHINVKNNKPVKYLEDGSFNMGQELQHEITVTFSPIGKNKVSNAARLSEHKVFMNGNVFGFVLGQAKADVLNKLGSPSALINYGEGRQAYLFGRRHVFYFTEHSFIGYQYTNWLLPPHLSNNFDYHDTFDEIEWVFENTIKIGASLTDIENVLKREVTLEDGHLAIIEHGNIQTTLSFLNQKYLYDDNKRHYRLNTVSIFGKDYQPIVWLHQDDMKKQRDDVSFGNSFDESVVSALLTKSRAEVVNKLGQPNSIIYKSLNKDIWIYGQSLEIKFINDAVFRYLLQ